MNQSQEPASPMVDIVNGFFKGQALAFELADEIEKHSHVKPTVCETANMRLNNSECIELGECSWFRHSQDGFKLSNESNLPPGFVEC